MMIGMCRPLNIDIILQVIKMSIDVLNFEGDPAPLQSERPRHQL